MSEKTVVNKNEGFARGYGQPESGTPVAHPGRGGQNVHLDEKPYANHPRGGGAAGMKYISEEEVQSDKPEIKGNFKGHAGSGAEEGEPVAHPGRGGQNYSVEHATTPSHPRGGGALNAKTETGQELGSDNQTLDASQMEIIKNRIHENIQNQSPAEER